MKRSTLKRKTPLRAKKKKRVPKGATSIERLLGEGKIKKASTLSTKRKPTGEKEVFRRIWDAADGNAKCLTCGTAITEGRAINFSHLLPKGKYPEYRLDKRNIVLQCSGCHMKWHMYGSELREHRKWNQFFLRYDDLWDEANKPKQQ